MAARQARRLTLSWSGRKRSDIASGHCTGEVPTWGTSKVWPIHTSPRVKCRSLEGIATHRDQVSHLETEVYVVQTNACLAG